MIKDIKTYWESVDKNWLNLVKIMARFLPTDGIDDIDGKLLPHPLYVEIEALKQSHDPKLVDYFQAAWCAAPDRSWIHEIPGWGVLCELCSESYDCFCD